jgi:hypothetical protein
LAIKALYGVLFYYQKRREDGKKETTLVEADIQKEK